MSASLPIVICGESLLDVFQNGTTPNGLHLDAVVGGSPLNVAAGVQRMGGRAVFLGAVSRDFLGDRILASIEQEGISTEALVRCDAPTTLSLVGVDAAGVPSYRFYGHGGADRQLLPEHLAALPAQVAAIHFGSYGCVVEPIGSTLRALVEARHRDTVISFDPNVRLNVEPSHAVWREHIEWMASRTHLLKLSDEDFERLYPGEDIEAAARRRVREELGLEVTELLPAVPDFRYRAVDASGIVENEFCPVFIGHVSSSRVAPDPDEVAEHAWVRWEDLVAAITATHQDAETMAGQPVSLKALLKRNRLHRLAKAITPPPLST